MWQIQKVADEGTAEPYVARLWEGAFELRDILLRHRAADDADFERRRQHFDDRYGPVLDALGAARKRASAIQELLDTHKQKIVAGSIVSRQRNTVQISETITVPMQEHMAEFLSTTARATKLLQQLLSYLDVEVGFLFQKQARFSEGLERLRAAGQAELADYLDSTRRRWSETLIERRHALEHKGWRLPDLRYVEQPDGSLLVIEPEVDGQPITRFVATILDRLLAFAEDMLAYAVQKGIAEVGDLIEIPKEDRDPANVKRFRFGVPAHQPNERFWHLRYSERGFHDS